MMKSFAVISDVHSNLEALYAVLAQIEKEHVDDIFFLGDSVGYGPDPDTCIEVLRKKADLILAGNHDRGAAGMLDTLYFNPLARTAVEWTAGVLSGGNLGFLSTLPVKKELKEDDIFLVHSTPFEPEEWHYLFSNSDIDLQFEYFDGRICFLGHSHTPFIAERTKEGTLKISYNRAEVRRGGRYIVNAGSVGQPRDGNPDAAYAVFRKDSLEIKRVPYDIVLTQKKMRKVGLPEFLIDRLVAGR